MIIFSTEVLLNFTKLRSPQLISRKIWVTENFFKIFISWAILTCLPWLFSKVCKSPTYPSFYQQKWRQGAPKHQSSLVLKPDPGWRSSTPRYGCGRWQPRPKGESSRRRRRRFWPRWPIRVSWFLKIRTLHNHAGQCCLKNKGQSVIINLKHEFKLLSVVATMFQI